MRHMRRQIVIGVCSAVLGFVTLSSHAVAQQKTVKECQEEWKANKAANKANGVTEKAYVAQCRGGAASAQPTAAPAAAPTPARPPKAAASGQKTVKDCQEEWRANKAANKANGITEKAYVAECHGGGAPPKATAAPAASPPSAPAPAPTAATPPAKPVTRSTSAEKPTPRTVPAPIAANEFSTEAQAKVRCPSDTVVWVNLTSKI